MGYEIVECRYVGLCEMIFKARKPGSESGEPPAATARVEGSVVGATGTYQKGRRRSFLWEILFVVWVIGVNVFYYWQFRDLIALYLGRCCRAVALPW